MCIELRFQGLRQALSLGQPAFELHPESLLLVDLHNEVPDLQVCLRGFLLGLLERFLQRAYDLLLLVLMLPALLKKCLLQGSLVLLLECRDIRGVCLLSAWISLDTAPFAGRGDCSALASFLGDNTNSSKRALVVFRFFVGCTSESESPVSWASDFSDLPCTASRSRDRTHSPTTYARGPRLAPPQGS